MIMLASLTCKQKTVIQTPLVENKNAFKSAYNVTKNIGMQLLRLSSSVKKS